MKRMRHFASILTLFMTFLLISPKSYAHFDGLTTSDNPSINIGYWVLTTRFARDTSNTDLTYLFNNIFAENTWAKPWVKKIIFTTDSSDNITGIQRYYSNNTIFELQESLFWWKAFFTIPYNPSGYETILNPVYGASGTNLNVPALKPGESVRIPQVLLTSNITNNNDPIVLSLSMKSDLGLDLADFAVEPIFDFSPFTQNSPFATDYILYSNNKWALSGSSSAANNTPTILTSNTTFTTLPREGANAITHKITYPTVTGDWGRLQGINYYLEDKNKNPKFIQDQQYGMRQGLLLLGRPSGESVSLRLEITQRQPMASYSLDAIPFYLNVSRGCLLDSSGICPASNATAIQPSVQVLAGTSYY